MNDIVKSNKALPAAIGALANIGQNAAATTGSIGTGDAFGRFTKDGAWTYGQEEIVVEEKSQWIINPLSLRHGHIGWPEEGGRPTELTVPLTDPLPPEPDDESLRWNNTMTWQARCHTGEDRGQQVLFKGGSLGFLKATTSLAQKIAERAQAGEEALVPVVTLEGSHYQHKKYGRINTPELELVAWVTMDGYEQATPVEEEAAEPEPTPEPETAPEPEKAAPRRRRRVRK